MNLVCFFLPLVTLGNRIILFAAIVGFTKLETLILLFAVREAAAGTVLEKRYLYAGLHGTFGSCTNTSALIYSAEDDFVVSFLFHVPAELF